MREYTKEELLEKITKYREDIRCMSMVFDNLAAITGTPKGCPDSLLDCVADMKEALQRIATYMGSPQTMPIGQQVMIDTAKKALKGRFK